MHNNAVHGPTEEKMWSKAKDIAEKEGKKDNYAFIMHIFQTMKAAHKKLKT